MKNNIAKNVIKDKGLKESEGPKNSRQYTSSFQIIFFCFLAKKRKLRSKRDLRRFHFEREKNIMFTISILPHVGGQTANN